MMFPTNIMYMSHVSKGSFTLDLVSKGRSAFRELFRGHMTEVVSPPTSCFNPVKLLLANLNRWLLHVVLGLSQRTGAMAAERDRGYDRKKK